MRFNTLLPCGTGLSPCGVVLAGMLAAEEEDSAVSLTLALAQGSMGNF